MSVEFSDEAIAQLFDWAKDDPRASKKILALIADIQKHGLLQGTGQPERLKHRENVYSRRINQKDRLVYKHDGKKLFIVSCRGHYED